jgi:hypothetical protein
LGVITGMGFPMTTLRSAGVAVTLLLALGILVLIGTTRTTKTCGMTFYENATLKFKVSVVPDRCVDPTGQRFWVAIRPGETKCIAGVNIPVAHRQITFSLLRWSWRG